MARYTIINDGKVTNFAEASADFAASQGWILSGGEAHGDLWDGTKFSKPPPYIPTKAEFNAPILVALDTADFNIIRALTEGDTVRIATHITAQTALRATLQA